MLLWFDIAAWAARMQRPWEEEGGPCHGRRLRQKHLLFAAKLYNTSITLHTPDDSLSLAHALTSASQRAVVWRADRSFSILIIITIILRQLITMISAHDL